MLDPDYVMEKLIELEDTSRRNNLRIDGISEVSHETWEMCEDSVKDLIKTKLEIMDIYVWGNLKINCLLIYKI